MSNTIGTVRFNVHTDAASSGAAAPETRWKSATAGGASMRSLAGDSTSMLNAARRSASLPAPDLAQTGRARSDANAASRPHKGVGPSEVKVRSEPGGGVVFSKLRALIKEITFSGGGGKGAALPGALAALEKSGILKQWGVKLNGASVGSMTAACIACGVKADRLKEISARVDMREVAGDVSNFTRFGIVIRAALKGAITGSPPLTGARLENMVRTELRQSVCDRILEFKDQVAAGTAKADPQAMAKIDAIYARLTAPVADGEAGPGVTFGELKTLSESIIAIKEVAIAGTMIASDIDGGAIRNPKNAKEGRGAQLVMFDAATQPDLDVAVAVHASAALPPVFSPVDIPLAQGFTGRFIDGGVLNNAPRSDFVNADTSVDAVPDESKLAFIFGGDEADDVMAGAPKMEVKLANQKFTKGLAASNDYARTRYLADRRDDVVAVPLRFGKKDFSGLKDGTMNFSIPVEDQEVLQSMAFDATSAHLEKMKQPMEHRFASAGQMMNGIPRADLAELAAADYPGAAETLAFRDAAKERIAELSRLAADAPAASLNRDGFLSDAMVELDRLVGGDPDRGAFVARELARSGDNGLAHLLEIARQNPAHGSRSLVDAMKVADGQRARTLAFRLLREEIYPKMVTQGWEGSGADVLKAADHQLRAATTPEELKAALDKVIDHFATKSDRLGRHGHAEFAGRLRTLRNIVG